MKKTLSTLAVRPHCSLPRLWWRSLRPVPM